MYVRTFLYPLSEIDSIGNAGMEMFSKQASNTNEIYRAKCLRTLLLPLFHAYHRGVLLK